MKTKLIISQIIFLTLIPVILMAQPGFPGTAQQTPLSGLGILAALGGSYAIKKIRDRNKS